MDDSCIIELFFQRNEEAIAETVSKFGSYCYGIAFCVPDFITYKVTTPIMLDQVDHLFLEDGTAYPSP